MSQWQDSSIRKFVWLLFLLGIIIILTWAGLKIWRTYQAATSLMARQEQAEILLSNGLNNLDLDSIDGLVNGIRSDVKSLQNELGFLMPVLPLLSWVPKAGPLALAAPHLLEMADAGSEAAAFVYRGLAPALELIQAEDDLSIALLPDLLGIVDEAKPDLSRATLGMDRVVAAREALGSTEELPWRLRSLLDIADPWLALAADGLRVSQLLPEMMGYYGPRRYLVLAQNENELRATGGFISGVGLIEVDNGRVVRFDFRDANNVDAFANPDNIFGPLRKPYGSPPQALSDFMLIDLFLFRDSNFWPDYPISAQKAMDLFSYGQDIPPLDGAIAIDQQFLAMLLAGTGPITIPESGEIIDQNNIIESLQNAWSLEDGVLRRKSFLGPFSLAIFNRLKNEPFALDLVTLARKMDEALQGKNLQIYLRDPSAESVLKDMGWDGRLIAPDGHDVLLIVDTNVGYNKANLFIQRDMQYNVHLHNDGSAEADLILTHRHTGEPSDESCLQGTTDVYENLSTYLALADKCYWNYLRVYVPETSQLLTGTQHFVPADTWFGGFDWDQPTEVFVEIPGFTTFGNFMLVPRGESVTSHYRYQLPQVVTPDEDQAQTYQLQLKKQAGAPSIKTEVTINLPEDTTLISVAPVPTSIDANILFFEVDLNSDQWISIQYR
ncbi:MAG: DUF4012 domain-containing protein [Candidatus Promineifilaceae bacterium]|nr:DUF4012 domain-containing protein [Candidatus Promineifilaceae bacterium]